MPELPEVEVLVRHLRARLKGETIRGFEVRRDRVIRPHRAADFHSAIEQARILRVRRRGKYLVFDLRDTRRKRALTIVGHLGMTGRMFVQSARHPVPRHTAAILHLGGRNLVFQDTRCFGRLLLGEDALKSLGPEPLSPEFDREAFSHALKRSAQPIKVRLLDQSLVAGIGNIYASEALFQAGISPRVPARGLTREQVKRLHRAIRAVLNRAIRFGSTIPLDWAGETKGDGLFYHGQVVSSSNFYEERLRVYDREGQPCRRCRTPIKCIVQGARSTWFCPRCQTRRGTRIGGKIS